ncbi:hypothetical protein SAMN02746066_04500 [Anaerosporobacter mobilis DSM 15930]|jgi:hypothetical protein|uniref:Uncharacterized protein n=1 Tax=Anaerosporobacter mobilis DSM 15930 TaxID=1120996 RepID=A0A1M7NJ13_9FIRM|nr:hypothetical protein [Anaerosporobacter mobilis]SHN03260.1 hypothetical protein SAMN02746066_04500 [Anaerosporobacter mobilis DSM 15930]
MKIDKAIQFINDNYCMINSIATKEEKRSMGCDVSRYLIKQLEQRKKAINDEQKVRTCNQS